MVRSHGQPPFRAVVLHGGPGAPGSAAPLAEELGRTVGTLEPFQTEYTVEGLLDELDRQIADNAVAPVTLIGHSWGAWLGLLYAAREPNRVRRLVMVDSGPLVDTYVPEIAARRRARLTPGERLEFDEALLVLQGGDSADPASGKDALSLLERLTARSDNYRLRGGAETSGDPLVFDAEQYARIWAEAERLRADGCLLEAARAVAAPIAVLHGREDPHPYEGVTRPLAQAGVACDAHVFERCGHSPFLEQYAFEPFFALLYGYCRDGVSGEKKNGQ